MATTNKGLIEPANGSDVGTWDIPVNGNMTQIDTALGGVTSLNVTAASGVVVLNLAQYTPPIINITGTLTANVTYQVPAGVGGFWIVNNGTSGAFTLTWDSGGAGASYVLPQAQISVVYCDGASAVGGVANYLLAQGNSWAKGQVFPAGIDVTTLTNDHSVRIRADSTNNVGILQFTNNAGNSQYAILTCNSAGLITASGPFTTGGLLSVAGSASTASVSVAFSATAMSLNCALSNVYSTTFTGNVTAPPAVSGQKDGQTINWFIIQDATGGRTMTWPTNFKWPGGAAGVLSTAANAVDLLVGTYRAATGNWYVALQKAFS